MPRYKNKKIKIELLNDKIIIPNLALRDEINEVSKEFVIKKLEEAFAFDCSIEEACLFANISRNLYNQLITENPKLLERFEMFKNYPILKARQAVINSFEKNPKIALDYLERKRAVEFSLSETKNKTLGGSTIKIKLDFGDGTQIEGQIEKRGRKKKQKVIDGELLEAEETQEQINELQTD